MPQNAALHRAQLTGKSGGPFGLVRALFANNNDFPSIGAAPFSSYFTLKEEEIPMDELIVFGVPIPIAAIVSTLFFFVAWKIVRTVTKWIIIIAILAFIVTYISSSVGFSQIFSLNTQMFAA